MLNFTVGPVTESEEVLKWGAEPTPYFRNEYFSKIMLENEQMMKKLVNASCESRVVFLTASGTGAMEAAVINSFTKQDKVLVVDGGSFGHRFATICELHEIPYETIAISFNELLTEDKLLEYENQGFTGFLINVHETSIGKLYDMKIVSEFCKRNKLFLIVDAISSFLADPFDMTELGVDIMITCSQKALAVPPGVSVLVMSERAVRRAYEVSCKCMYLNLPDALTNGERGQTPFTPAVGILIQINARLKSIIEKGIESETKRMSELASYFRAKITNLPLKIATKSLSNAVTPLLVNEDISAYDLFQKLEKEYNIWICPSGGELKDKLFRVGHLGAINIEDIDTLVDALSDCLSNMNKG